MTTDVLASAGRIQGKSGKPPGFFFAPSPLPGNNQGEILTENFSKSRQRAEAAFRKVQSLSRDSAISEIDAAAQARDEKTIRLRALRMAKEAGNLASVPSLEKPDPSGR
jgi:hypothetical protein